MKRIIFVEFLLFISIIIVDSQELPVNYECSADNSTDRVPGNLWKWNLDEKHRCNIRRMSLNSLYSEFQSGLPPLHHEPIVIYHEGNETTVMDCNNRKFQAMTAFSEITNALPENFDVTLTSSNSFSAHRRVIPLVQYLEETILSENSPTQLSNETWYLFGETYTDEWKKLLNFYCLPACETCTRDLTALAFGIGGRGSGVQWHIHGPGFSQALHGRKHWVLYPPDKQPNYDPDYTSRHWMEEVYTSLKDEDLPWECTLYPGDMIYFPDHWYHATLNLDHYTAFISSFTTEHVF